MNEAIWGFIGALIGAGASILTTLINSRNSVKLQLKLEKVRRENLAKDFQRDNLLVIQEKLYHHFRLTLRAVLERGSNNDSLLNEELADNLSYSLRELTCFIERVEQQDLRNQLTEIKNDLATIPIAKSKDEGMDRLVTTSSQFDRTLQLLGQTLRATF
ncbi:hypothetical protein BFP72_03750 [Reichenbachiella sp. 5M10]|uniref:hypothetical protein n=1 Tax=Reichenbachiella sp. 5M10 TaxID=1889772 RepID=UPI000C15B368|nr:hypothetical protein [Reichenbachiella sp. 5M10]PIB34585.1 hypothetical protein BFP72_03750 [Reichenbachiella sp. 5M10]